MKREKQRKNRGIILISLVITIIILLILSAITLNLVIGENGMFHKAQYAKKQYEIAQELLCIMGIPPPMPMVYTLQL